MKNRPPTQTPHPVKRQTLAPKRRRFPCAALSLFLVAVLCLAAFLASNLWFNLPAQIESTFGPPSPRLSPWQRISLSALLMLQKSELTLPHNASGHPQPFEVQLGETAPTIARRLQSEGLISDAQAFRNYLVYAGLDTTIQAGAYELSPQMTALEIAQELQDATPTEVAFTILPGWRLEEIAATLPTSGLAFTPEAFLQAASRPPQGYAFLENLPTGASLEGFLLPGVYRLPRDITVEQFINILLDHFAANLSSELQSGFSRQGLTLFEALILASIVEREAILEDEMPLIASVFLNRLEAGIKLDSDPTVQYAVGYNDSQQTWWTNPLSLANLQTESPYNTYIYPGLPPGPIANPSLKSLQAVAFPAQTPYYYFRAACQNQGRHTFAETLQEHINNACP